MGGGRGRGLMERIGEKAGEFQWDQVLKSLKASCLKDFTFILRALERCRRVLGQGQILPGCSLGRPRRERDAGCGEGSRAGGLGQSSRKALQAVQARELGAALSPLLKENICTGVRWRVEGVKVSTCSFSATPVTPQ